MHGTQEFHFSELFADTCNAHGMEWAFTHYTRKGMQEWEFWFWVSACANTLHVF